MRDIIQDPPEKFLRLNILEDPGSSIAGGGAYWNKTNGNWIRIEWLVFRLFTNKTRSKVKSDQEIIEVF